MTDCADYLYGQWVSYVGSLKNVNSSLSSTSFQQELNRTVDVLVFMPEQYLFDDASLIVAALFWIVGYNLNSSQKRSLMVTKAQPDSLPKTERIVGNFLKRIVLICNWKGALDTAFKAYKAQNLLIYEEDRQIHKQNFSSNMFEVVSLQ